MSPASAMLHVLDVADNVVAVAKPSGLPVVPAPDGPQGGCLHRQVEDQLGQRLWVVHRIDRDTSGVVVFARDADTHRRLSLAFEHRRVRKHYIAFVAGVPDPPLGTIDAALHQARKGRMRPAGPGETGLPSITDYAVRRHWTRGESTISLVDASPRTGRHHQIRVHSRSIGTPILFDAVYGQSRSLSELEGAPCRRLALHAASIELPGADGGMARFEAPLAADLAALGVWLDAEWRREPSGMPPDDPRHAGRPATSWLP